VGGYGGITEFNIPAQGHLSWQYARKRLRVHRLMVHVRRSSTVEGGALSTTT